MTQDVKTLVFKHLPSQALPSMEPKGEERRKDQGREGGLGQLVPARRYSMPCPPAPNHSVCALS
jgi:hypothetical protein